MNQTPSEQMATFATAVANECKATRAVAESAKEISDSVTGTGSTWSSSKISSELTAAKNSVKNELSDRISSNANAIESLEATTLTKTDASKTYLGKTAKASSATTADSATKATQDASGNVITSTYATKASLASVATSGEYSDLSGVPTALKNPTALTLQNSAGTSIGSYDGSTATTVKLTASTVGLGNVTNESKATMFTSAALTGTPTAPTATAGTNTTQVATTAFVTTAVANKTSVSGNAGTATKLATAKTIALSGDVSGSADFDGSEGITITATVADDSHNHIIGNVDGLQTALNAKAPLASPTLTGTPKAPTATAGTNTTQIATTAFVTTAVSTAESSAKSYTDTKVANLVNSAPETLDTLGELATALSENVEVTTALNTAIGSKANTNEVVKLSGDQTIAGTKTFSSPISGSISGNAATATKATQDGSGNVITSTYAPLASPTFTGTPKAPTAAAGTNTTQVATTAFVTTAVANKTSVASATKATQDGSGNVITSTYATKTELTNGLSDKANTATTLAGYGITDAYTKSQTNSNFIGWDRGALDVDTLYNTGLYMVASGKNVPSGSNYGVVLTMPYRQMQGNTKTDFGVQIFLPNGDDDTHPNSMFFRTSLGASWNRWQEAATTAWVQTFVSNALSGISGASVAQVGDIKLFHGSLGGSDGRRPVDGKTGIADEAWELCDGTNGTPDMRGQLAYGAGGTLAVGAAHGAPATSVDKAGFDYALGSRSGQSTTTVLTSTPQGVGLYYLKKTS